MRATSADVPAALVSGIVMSEVTIAFSDSNCTLTGWFARDSYRAINLYESKLRS